MVEGSTPTLLSEEFALIGMIPLVVIGCSSFSGFSGYSGSLNVPIDASVIISFGKHEKLENPE